MSIIIVFKSLLMIIFPCYRVNFQVDKMPEEFVYTDYSKNNRYSSRAQSTIVKSGDQTYGMLKQFLTEEKEGWRYEALMAFVPERIFDSPTMKINCGSDAVVINYTSEDEGRVQIIKRTDGGCPPVNENSK